ncbi:MAG: hypothetical protein OXC68_00150, partial [Aestuariivita sp.]|nr:hypothetical protein [Aestuariivita sp.]
MSACREEGECDNAGRPVCGCAGLMYGPNRHPVPIGRARLGRQEDGPARSTGEVGSCRWREGAGPWELEGQETATGPRVKIDTGRMTSGGSRAYFMRKRSRPRAVGSLRRVTRCGVWNVSGRPIRASVGMRAAWDCP